jgi:hypothetical protein
MKNRLLILTACFVAAVFGNGDPSVSVVRTPNGGIQPQASVDERGTLHLIYFKGDPGAGDIFYVHRRVQESAFSAPLLVNSRAGSAVATGTIRGAHLAIGRNGRVHVAWNGSKAAEPSGPAGSAPMLYARLNDAGNAFEPERNLMHIGGALDGGGTLTADRAGNVWVAWHGMGDVKGEEHRRVYVAHSGDDGKTFAREEPAWGEATGACACCGMRAFTDDRGTVYMLYRAATEGVNRDMVLLTSSDTGKTFRGRRIHPWKLNACPMSSESFAEGGGVVEAAWETQKQIYFAKIDTRATTAPTVVSAPGEGSRKHPALAVNQRGETLLAWAEGTGWQKGGTLGWQVYDAAGRPVGDKGAAASLPTWSLPAAFTKPDGTFVVIY